MKYLIPFMFALAFAMPLPAHAADPACVLDNCPKTDPAKEAEKEMGKAAGVQVPIEAPVETAKPVTPMQANEAIKEIEQAVEKEAVEQKITGNGSGAVPFAPSTQQPTCSTFAQNQAEVKAKVLKNEQQHFDEQKIIGAKIQEGIRHHLEEQIRIGQILKDATTKHAEDQRVQMAASADYQRKLKEDGLVLREKLASNVRQHKEEGLALRCLTTERMMSFHLQGSMGTPVQQQMQGQR